MPANMNSSSPKIPLFSLSSLYLINHFQHQAQAMEYNNVYLDKDKEEEESSDDNPKSTKKKHN
jgi:hypothetical protein|tara:strand:+ start:217 stop:405 length:189 start_codon:yes stop_codon:yes gene_type:complete